MLIRLVCAIKSKKLWAKLLPEFSDMNVQVKICDDHKTAWTELMRSSGDVLLVSQSILPRPIETSMSLLNQLPEKPTIILLNELQSPEDHAHLLAAGADVVLYTGLAVSNLLEAIEGTLESRRQMEISDRFDRRGRLKPRLNDFISHSKEMQIFLEQVQQVIPTDSTLLIQGETGVGKEHLSKAIHAESHRSKGPFIALNMAAIPEQLLESELFGHEQGAFTGAIRSRRGAFELAHGGTLFLDEIADMPLLMQTKLLRVLQEFEMTPVGSEKPVWVDVRVIAATNKNLEEEVRKGHFRRDLYYRLSVISLTLPPLRQRKEDIPILANHFLKIYNIKMRKNIVDFTLPAMEALTNYAWPGNIRELINVIERAIILCRLDSIHPKDLPNAFQNENPVAEVGSEFPAALNQSQWKHKTLHQVRHEALRFIEKAYLKQALTRSEGRVGEAARLAGIHPRGLYSKMKELGLNKNDFKNKTP